MCERMGWGFVIERASIESSHFIHFERERVDGYDEERELSVCCGAWEERSIYRRSCPE